MTNSRSIKMGNGKLTVPDNPIIPFIEGDGIGVDIWPASKLVLDSAVEKAYSGSKKIIWKEVLAGEKAYNNTGEWLPQETLDKLPWGEIYVGQMQKWFVFKFSGQSNDINVETENPEFSEWKWMNSSNLINNAVPFKRIVYKTILDEFSDIF